MWIPDPSLFCLFIISKENGKLPLELMFDETFTIPKRLGTPGTPRFKIVRPDNEDKIESMMTIKV